MIELGDIPMGKSDSVKAWTCLLSAWRCLAMGRVSVMRRRFQEWTERIGFQEKLWCGCAARWRASSDWLGVSSCSSVRAFKTSSLIEVHSKETQILKPEMTA